jgi:D-alanyl-D-alanine carboxypeptidase (penicillin-binding protein 5/6)
MRTPRRPAVLRAGLVALTAGTLALSTPVAHAAEPTGRVADGLQVGAGAPAPPEGISAAGWLVADADTGEVLAARQAHEPFAPASTLKVLTALALLPVVPREQVVVPSQAEVDVEGSKVGLVRDVPYTGEQLYTALLTVSGNDAANALAGAAGGRAAAAAAMNAEAARLGAEDTHAVNPHGLDADGQVTTAYDLAVIGRAALDSPAVARWVTTRRSTMPGGPGKPQFEIVNKNKLLGSYDGALGVKNGYTTSARATFIGAAERDGHRLVVTLLRADPRVWEEAGRLLDWGFAALDAGAQPVGSLPAPPEPEGEARAAAAAEPAGGSGTSATSPEAPGTDVALPARQLAGALLVAAAVVAVRPGRPGRRRIVTA